jgi:hypothetical protein
MIPEILLNANREKLLTYLRSARDYATPHDGLSHEQLLQEMERIRGTLDAVIEMVRCGERS